MSDLKTTLTRQQWLTAYRAALLAAALERGWSRENADDWASAIADDAWLSAGERDPAKCGAADVIQCEAEAANV